MDVHGTAATQGGEQRVSNTVRLAILAVVSGSYRRSTFKGRAVVPGAHWRGVGLMAKPACGGTYEVSLPVILMRGWWLWFV